MLDEWSAIFYGGYNFLVYSHRKKDMRRSVMRMEDILNSKDDLIFKKAINSLLLFL